MGRQRAEPSWDPLAMIRFMQPAVQLPLFSPELLIEFVILECRAQAPMGGPGDLDLLHAAVALSGEWVAVKETRFGLHLAQSGNPCGVGAILRTTE